LNLRIVYLLLHLFVLLGSARAQVLTVGNIEVQGNRKTKTAVILREIVFKRGDTLSTEGFEKGLRHSQENLINTNLFLEAELAHVTDGTGKVDITVFVKERWYMSVLPHLVLGDRSFNEWWYERGRDLKRLTYGLNVNHFNFTGNGDVLTVRAHFGFTPYYQLAYTRPYIDKSKRLGFSTRLFYTTRRAMPYRTWNDKLSFISSDSLMFQRFGAAVDFRYRRNHNYFHTWTSSFTRTRISDTVALANREYFGDGRTSQPLLYVGYEFRSDFRDVRQYALKGNLFIAAVGHFFAFKGKDQTNIVAQYQHFFPLGNRLFFDTQVRGKVSFPSSQSYFLVSGLGYGGNLARGYELYVVDGQYFALNRNTLKWKVFERSFDISWLLKKKEFSTLPIQVFPNIYSDYAFVKNFNPEWSNSHLSNTHLWGGGVGLDIVTFYNVNIRTYYSINQMGERNVFFTFGREF
jgi:outer membrane protein assembly factor BamA